ncbi:MAG: Ig-like domain-containing protein [Clostridia bacterium]
MKRCAFALLLTALLLTAVGALGEGTLVEESNENMLFQTGGLPTAQQLSVATLSTSAFDEYVANELSKQTTEINVRQFGLTPPQLRNAFFSLINARPELFYVDAYRYYIKEEFVISILPQYRYSGADLQNKIAAFNAELDRIVEYASAATTPLGKALLVNDYFCVNYCYDSSLTIFDAYTLFTQKTGVCQAYMLGYRAAMNRLGIPSKTASSTSMNHTWNVVQINGSWYHVDVTWNDPTRPDVPYRARHQYFLCSDGGLEGHSGWDIVTGATNTYYDNFFWAGVDFPIPVVGDTLYCVDSYAGNGIKTVREWTMGSPNLVVLHQFETYWAAWSGGYYDGYYGMIGVCNDRIYYATYDRIYSIAMDGSDERVAALVDTSNGYLNYGYVLGNVAYYGISTSPWKAGSRASVVLVENVQPTQIMLEPAELVLGANGTRQLKARFIPSYATAAVVWSSKDTSIATVSATGLVTAVAEGETAIVAQTGLLSAESKVKVITLSANPAELMLERGEVHRVTMNTGAGVAPALSWKSSNTKVAAVDAYGVITAKENGSAVMTVSLVSDAKINSTFTVIVKAMKRVTLPARLTQVQAGAFEGDAMERLVGGDALTNIGSRAFANCAALRSVTLESAVAVIAEDAFDGCTNLVVRCPPGSYAESYALAKGFAVQSTKP